MQLLRVASSQPDPAAQRVKPEELPTKTFLSGAISGAPDPAIEASWEVSARVIQRTLDPGDRIDIQVFFTGYGPVSTAKITWYFPENLLAAIPDSAAPHALTHQIEATANVGYLFDDQSRVSAAALTSDKHLFPGSSGLIRLTRGYFYPAAVPSQGIDLGNPIPWNPEVCMVVGERARPSPPITMSGRISEDAPTGEHSVPFVLTFRTQDKVKTSAYHLELHIRPFWERRPFQILAAVAAILASGGGAVAIVLAFLH